MTDTEFSNEQKIGYPESILYKKKIKFIFPDKHGIVILIINRPKDLDYVQTLIQGSLLEKKLKSSLLDCFHIILILIKKQNN